MADSTLMGLKFFCRVESPDFKIGDTSAILSLSGEVLLAHHKRAYIVKMSSCGLFYLTLIIICISFVTACKIMVLSSLFNSSIRKESQM